MTENEGINEYTNGLDLYKASADRKIWQVETPNKKGEFLFTFDKKKVFNFFKDYPEKLSDDELMKIMKDYFDGKILSVVENAFTHNSVKELAIDFLVYGTLAEIFARETGFHRGLGGSMHAFFCPFGIYPNNAIVGGSATIATGSALYKKVNKKSLGAIALLGLSALLGLFIFI